MNMAKSKNMGTVNTGNKMMSLSKAKAIEIVVVRILAIILTDIVVSSIYNYINSEAMRQWVFHSTIQTPVTIVCGVLLVLSLAYLVVAQRKTIDTSAHYVTPAMITAVTLYLTVTSLFFDRFTTSPFLFYTMTVIVSVLFAVYYIYTVILYKK